MYTSKYIKVVGNKRGDHRTDTLGPTTTGATHWKQRNYRNSVSIILKSTCQDKIKLNKNKNNMQAVSLLNNKKFRGRKTPNKKCLTNNPASSGKILNKLSERKRIV